jgi:hypothetical protein
METREPGTKWQRFFQNFQGKIKAVEMMNNEICSLQEM